MNDNEDWIACPPGTFQKVQGEFSSSAQSRKLQPYIAGASLAFLAAAVLFGFSLLRSDSEPSGVPGGLICHDVMPLLERYHNGSLSQEMQFRVTQHLQECDRCAEHYAATFLDRTAHRRDPRPGATMLATNGFDRH